MKNKEENSSHSFTEGAEVKFNCEHCKQEFETAKDYAGHICNPEPSKQQLTPLQELIEKIKEHIKYFSNPYTDFQAGRKWEAINLLELAESLLPKERQREEEMERLKEEIISMRGNSKAASGLLAKARDEIKELKEELRRWESGELNIEM